MFRSVEVVLVNKTDSLPHLTLTWTSSVATSRRSTPALGFEVSARTGGGLDAWHGWLADDVATARARRADAAPHPGREDLSGFAWPVPDGAPARLATLLDLPGPEPARWLPDALSRRRTTSTSRWPAGSARCWAGPRAGAR
ncbi:MAG: hypothetical protein R2734_08650 [Nocardioides sp.]